MLAMLLYDIRGAFFHILSLPLLPNENSIRLVHLYLSHQVGSVAGHRQSAFRMRPCIHYSRLANMEVPVLEIQRVLLSASLMLLFRLPITRKSSLADRSRAC